MRKGQADYVRKVYDVPAKQGMRVTVDGCPGGISSFKDARLMVRFDGWGFSMPCHPTWRVVYLTDADTP
jgi:hypothetical protein